MRRRAVAIGALLATLLCFLLPGSASAQDARGFIARLGEQAIQVLGPSVPATQRLARFRALFHDDFDMPGISQFVLGRYWRMATPQEQQEFVGLFQEYITRAYATRLSQYGGEPFRVTGARLNGEETVVTSQIVRQNGNPIEVDWFVIGQPGQYRITDANVGGVSMKVTHRDEFAAIIQRNGGRVDALLAQLRQKLAAS